MAKRFPHYLGDNRASQMPAACVWLDTETRPVRRTDGSEEHHLTFGYAAYRRRRHGQVWTTPEWLRFEDTATLWDWLLAKTRAKTRLHVFAHNFGFDFPVLAGFSVLRDRGWTLNSAIVDAPPIVLDYRQGNRTLRFVDTLNLWRMPLAAIGQRIGLDKLTMPAPDAPAAEWDAYGRRDVEVLMAATLQWFRFLTDHDLGGFGVTLAQQAMKAYRHRFRDCPIFIDGNPRADALSREAYVGGRVECFEIGRREGRYHHIDVNSMYPAVMRDYTYPVKLRGHWRRVNVSDLIDECDSGCCVARVTVETDTPIYPAVRDGRLIFPVGRFVTSLATPELREALKRGHVAAAHECAAYERGRPFGSFIRTLYQMRRDFAAQGDEVGKWLTKILMNSLYGKFGQSGRRFEIDGEADDDSIAVWTEIDADSGEVHRMRQFGGIVQREIREPESRDSFPALAAHVTSHARMVLWRGIEQAGIANVLYCDTDCLLVNDEGLRRVRSLLHPDSLGAWKLEGSYDRVEIWGPKDYVFGDVRRLKGVRPSAEWVSNDTVEQDLFVGFRGLLQEGQLSAPVVRRVQKRLARQYLKGAVQPSGRVLPFALSE